MANIKAAKKKIRVINKKTLINKMRRSEIKTLLRKFDELLSESQVDAARELLKVIDRKLKKAEQRNILHKNNVSRKMSKLHLKLNRAS